MERYMEAFVQRVQREALPVEAIIAYVDDAKVFSHYFVPEAPRNIYSHTKSYMATAAGMAIEEGLLSLEDKVVDYFPELYHEGDDPRLEGITLHHLLTMSSGLGRAYLMSQARKLGEGGKDFVRYLFSHKMLYAPGEKFVYSNGDSYLAGRMVEKRVGMTLLEYLDTRLFRPLGIPKPQWESCPAGHSFGASGILMRAEDMMKLGRLYLNGGTWRGARIISPKWIQTASAKHIETPDAPENPWHCGYGYQFWRLPYGESYRADGAYGQISAVLPARHTVIGLQCGDVEGAFKNIRIALHEEVMQNIT